MGNDDREIDAQRRKTICRSVALIGAASTGLLTRADSAFAGSASSVTASAPLATGALVCDTYNYYRWTIPPATYNWNVLQDLFNNGVQWIRMWVTTQSFPGLRTTNNWYTIPFQTGMWSCLEVSGAILAAAAAQGFRLQAILFLSDQSCAAGNQPLAEAWVGLSPAQLAVQVQQHAINVATYYKSLGLNIEVFEIGNENDFGICGMNLGQTAIVPAGIDWTTNPNWMQDNVWGPMAPLLKAAIRGVLSVYPTAKILLHIAGFGYSPGNVLTSAFFKSMINLGVPFDIVGLSYPYLTVQSPIVPQPYFAQADFQNALESIAALGKTIQIVEFDYPANATGILQAPSPAYPLTPSGQANFVQDFASALLGKVDSLFYWYPDYYPGFNSDTQPGLESCGLFSAIDTPRPALGAFKNIAAGNIVSQSDCLFNWAERIYPQYFSPAGAPDAAFPPYTYRYYSRTGNYLAVSSTDNNVYVLGPSFGPNIVSVGPATSFLSASTCP